jgi:hypothetical protein
VRVSTARAFEDTGSTSKGFAGEEVDWYVCNVGSFHIKQSMDRSVPVVENKEVARWLMVEDTVLFQQTALAVGCGGGGARDVGRSLREQETVGGGSEGEMGRVLREQQSSSGDAG